MGNFTMRTKQERLKSFLNTVIFNVYGHGNTGDAMLLESLLDILAKVRPGDDLAGIAFDPASESKWVPEIPWYERIGNASQGGIPGRMRQGISVMVLLALASSRAFFGLRQFLPEAQRKAVEQLASADLAISCPGGYLEDSNTAYVLNLLQVLLACKLCPKVVLAPQSIGPIKSKLGAWLVSRAVRAVDQVFVREPESFAFIQKVLGPKEWQKHTAKITLVGDLAFWFERSKDDDLDTEIKRLGIYPNKPIIGLTVVNWNFPHVADPAAKREAYLEALSTLIRHVEACGTHQVVVFNQVESDLVLGRELLRRNPNIILDTFQRDSGLFCKLVGVCDVFVGTRFHSCIFGLLGGVPTVAVAYLPKTTGIMSDLAMQEYVLPIDTINGQELVTMCDRMIRDRAEISNRITASVKSYKQSRGAFIEYLTSQNNADHPVSKNKL